MVAVEPSHTDALSFNSTCFSREWDVMLKTYLLEYLQESFSLQTHSILAYGAWRL